MGNMQCPPQDAAHLASVARDICPFPNYNPSPLFFNMLSANSSRPLSDHYTAVQSSLTPKQLEDFTLGLKTTFGRGGNVTYGGIGVVALSLAVLFDTLAKQVRGEWVSDSGPIPDLFVKDLYYPPHVYTISRYLRMVPHIANNPTRMKEETERYLKQLMHDMKTLEEDKNKISKDDILGINIMLGEFFQSSLEIHLLRITNSTHVELQKTEGTPIPPTVGTESDTTHVSKSRKRRIPAPERYITFNLNCNPEEASKEFLNDVPKSNDTQAAFAKCQPFNGHIPKTWLHYIARLVWLDVVNNPQLNVDKESMINLREDFDLKANAHRKWNE
ncbi:uncharacterized protein LOC113172486 [Anabas testudineus]|uniref:uncharacterized protein LOC113172486 n=1 Tax=Anabas testudineus TaxID=64144 RepID=UPI000E4561DA|nr:uncharacterized protein LOC113172486 [Anabas testudineus]